MKTYIYGAGNIALHIIAKMKEYEGEITGFIDSYKKGEYDRSIRGCGERQQCGHLCAQYEQHIGNIPKIKTGRNL